MKATIASFALAIVLCGQAVAQEQGPPPGGPEQGPPPAMMNSGGEGGPGMPPNDGGRWWKNPDLVKKLQVTDDQIQKVEEISQDHELQEIGLRAELEKEESALRFQMEADPPNESNILAQIDKVTLARANVEKSNAELLFSARKVLTAEQARMLRDLRGHDGPPSPGFGPPDGGPGGPPEGGQNAPPDGPPGPPPNGDAN